MKKKVCLIFVVLVTLLLNGCSDEHPQKVWDWDHKVIEDSENVEFSKLGWNFSNKWGKLPEYIKIFESSNKMLGQKTRAFIAVVDLLKGGKFEVLGDIKYNEDAKWYVSKQVNTLSEFYSVSNCPIIINGGLFFAANGFYYSQNLVVRNGNMVCPNINYYSKDWKTIWYPTLGAFCQDDNGDFRTTWTYFTNSQENYEYSKPAENDINKKPLQVPNNDFPTSGKVLKCKNGIGGVGVLIHNGKIVNTFMNEMLDVIANSKSPRTAIGFTKDKKLILFVCEGRNKLDNILGLTCSEVSELMYQLGCTEALNLDGGGSSCMLINGMETIKCSDGKQRPVLTAVGIK